MWGVSGAAFLKAPCTVAAQMDGASMPQKNDAVVVHQLAMRAGLCCLCSILVCEGYMLYAFAVPKLWVFLPRRRTPVLG